MSTASPETEPFEPTPNTTVRYSDRASYDRAEVYRALDDGFVAHVGFATGDQPFVIPMVYGRDGDRLLLHGSVATRLMRALDKGAKVCITVTHVDGLVLARSHFHHSINYRSVVVLGTATRLRDADAEAAFDVIVDHVAPGRAAETRPTNDVERRQTMVLSVPLVEVSLKVRTGGPIDDPGDLDPNGPSNVWAGVLPMMLTPGEPIPDEFTAPGLDAPTSVTPWQRPT